MAEFVDGNLEKLLPVFEYLSAGQLFSKPEINEFIKRCRDHEYRIQKTVKSARDFLLYADYLTLALELIELRRKKLRHKTKRERIDWPLLSKVADVYRTCTSRFQGDKEAWRKYLQFLKNHNLRKRCSGAFLGAIQVNSGDTKLREEAARWEYMKNGSIDNARLHLQLSLRRFPECVDLWVTFFEIEICNAKKLTMRLKFLHGETDEKNKVGEQAEDHEVVANTSTNTAAVVKEDPVKSLKIARTVAVEGIKACKNKTNELILELWRKTKRFGAFAETLEKFLYDELWSPGQLSEESWLAKYEREAHDDYYEFLEIACREISTERMYRECINILEERDASGDICAVNNLYKILRKLSAAGFAKASDYDRMLFFETDREERQKILNDALRMDPISSKFRLENIRHAVETAPDNCKEIMKLFNENMQFMADDDMLAFYKIAIDWAISNCPRMIDGVFDKAILCAPREVSSELKCIRLKYTRAANPDNPNAYRTQYASFCRHPPNSRIVHETFIDLENKQPIPSKELIVSALENYVGEMGYEEHECWIVYSKYLLSNEPTALPKLYKRAVACIPSKLLGKFHCKWSVLMRDAAKYSRKSV